MVEQDDSIGKCLVAENTIGSSQDDFSQKKLEEKPLHEATISQNEDREESKETINNNDNPTIEIADENEGEPKE